MSQTKQKKNILKQLYVKNVKVIYLQARTK